MARTPSRSGTATASNEDVGQPTPRPRGRPKKVIAVGENHTAANFTPSVTPRGRGRPKEKADPVDLEEEAPESEQELAEPQESVPTPRSRGRPKKKVHHWSKQAREAAKLQQEAQLDNDDEPEETTPFKQPATAPRPRGRPKKPVTEASPEEVASGKSQKVPVTAATITTAKDELRAELLGLSTGFPDGKPYSTTSRGRGRPKKTQTVETEEVDSNEQLFDEVEHMSIKRGRGRPRKSDTPVKSAQGTVSRLQPFKHSETDTSSTLTAIATEGVKKRGRGRPKKNSSGFLGAVEVATNTQAKGSEAGDDAIDSQKNTKEDAEIPLAKFIEQDENDSDQDEDHEPSPSPYHSSSPSPSRAPPQLPSMHTVFRKRGISQVNGTVEKNPKKRLAHFTVARKTAARRSASSPNTRSPASSANERSPASSPKGLVPSSPLRQPPVIHSSLL